MNALTGTGMGTWKLIVIKGENTSELQQPMVLIFYGPSGTPLVGPLLLQGTYVWVLGFVLLTSLCSVSFSS